MALDEFRWSPFYLTLKIEEDIGIYWNVLFTKLNAFIKILHQLWNICSKAVSW